MKKIIGFDFDGVIANFVPHKIKLAQKFGFYLSPKQTPASVTESIMDKESYLKMAYDLYRGETLRFKPCRGVKHTIKKLKNQGHTLVIISARGEEESLFARKWLREEKLDVFFKKITFCPQEEKPNFINTYKAQVYIDDSPEVLDSCPRNIQRVLYNPHNIKFSFQNPPPVIIADVQDLLNIIIEDL